MKIELKLKFFQRHRHSTRKYLQNYMTAWNPSKSLENSQINIIQENALYCTNCGWIVLMPFLQALSVENHRLLYHSTMQWWSRCTNIVPIFLLLALLSSSQAVCTPALQVLLLPIMHWNVFSCQAMDSQPQILQSSEFFFSELLQHADNICLWQKDRAGAEVFLAEKKQCRK